MMNSSFSNVEPNDHIKEILRKRGHKDDIVNINRHTIKVEDITLALESPQVMAVSYSARTKTGKRIEFTPFSQAYRVVWGDENSETSSSFFDVYGAVEKYNEIDA